MPSWAKVRRTDNDDCSTSRVISSFSAAAYLIYRNAVRRTHPRSSFVEIAERP
jgi:hypothetical protein